jgi:hypothetical protein
VFRKLFAPGKVECSQCEREDKGSEDNMGDEDGKVNRANPTTQGKALGSCVVMIDEVAGKK